MGSKIILFASLPTHINTHITVKNQISIFVVLLAGLFLSSCEGDIKPTIPYRVHYSVLSDDQEVRDMVYQYFGSELIYEVYDSSHIYMTRFGSDNKLQHWYNGESLYIREAYGDYCDCVELSGEMLRYWLDNELAPAVMFNRDSEQKFGLEVKSGVIVTDEKDTTWISVAQELMSPWFDMGYIAGLPMSYSYRLRGQKVTYEVDSIRHLADVWSVGKWRDKCVQVPPESYLGFTMGDSLGVISNRVWMNGQIHDEEQSALSGEVGVYVANEDGTLEGGVSRIDNGNYDLQLSLGKLYVLDFSSENTVHRRIELDLRDAPHNGNEYAMHISVLLFEPENAEVEAYCREQFVGKGRYIAEEDAIGFDFEYTEAVKAETARLRGKDL